MLLCCYIAAAVPGTRVLYVYLESTGMIQYVYLESCNIFQKYFLKSTVTQSTNTRKQM